MTDTTDSSQADQPPDQPPDLDTGPRTLVLMRHAKAEQSDTLPDSQRGLTRRGRTDAARAGRWLADKDITPDLVLCSSSERTRQTWDALQAGGASAVDVRFEDAMYHGGAGAMLGLINEVAPDVRTILAIGHAPTVPWLVDSLVDGDQGAPEAHKRLDEGFPTCAFAVLRLDRPWSDITANSAELTDMVVPSG